MQSKNTKTKMLKAKIKKHRGSINKVPVWVTRVIELENRDYPGWTEGRFWT